MNMLRRFVVIALPIFALLDATPSNAAQGVAVRNSGETIITWAEINGSVHVANAPGGQVRGTFSPWTPIAGLDTNNVWNGASGPPATLAFHDANDNWASMWQGADNTLYYYDGSHSDSGGPPLLSQVTINGAPVTVCSAPTFTIAPSGIIYAAAAGCARGTYPLTVLAFSNGSWTRIPAPATRLAPGTGPAIFARTAGFHPGEIDIAFEANDGSLEYTFTVPFGDPTLATSWAAPSQIAAAVTSSPSLYVNGQDEAAVVAQTPNNVLGIWYASPWTNWTAVPNLAAGTAMGAPSIGGGFYAADPINAPGSVAEYEVIASPESRSGTVLLGIGKFSSAAGGFSFAREIDPGGPVVLGVGVGGGPAAAQDLWGNNDPWESSITVMSRDPNTWKLQIANIQRGDPGSPASWTAPGALGDQAFFEDPACHWPAQLTKQGTGARLGPVVVQPVYWGYNAPANEPNWVDYYNTLFGSSYYDWLSKQYGVPKATVSAPVAYHPNDSSLFDPNGTGCPTPIDIGCVVTAKVEAAAVAGTLPKPTPFYQGTEYMIHVQDTQYPIGKFDCERGFNGAYQWIDSNNTFQWIFFGIVSDGACNPNLDRVQSTVSHELIESLTDPGTFSGQNNIGWIDATQPGICETQIADLCDGEGFHILSTTTGANYEFDRMWSNVERSCQSTSATPVAIHILGKCMDVPAWQTANGTPVNIYDCTGNGNQEWFLNSDGTIRPAFAPSKCLELPASRNTDGTGVDLSDCNNARYQRWTRYLDGTIRGFDGKCLDNPNSQTQNATQFDYWDCNGGANQNFQLQ
jgi:hypothetical protein